MNASVLLLCFTCFVIFASSSSADTNVQNVLTSNDEQKNLTVIEPSPQSEGNSWWDNLTSFKWLNGWSKENAKLLEQAASKSNTLDDSTPSWETDATNDVRPSVPPYPDSSGTWWPDATTDSWWRPSTPSWWPPTSSWWDEPSTDKSDAPTTGSWWPPASSSSWWAPTSSWWDEPSTDRSDAPTTGSWWPPISSSSWWAPTSSWWDEPSTDRSDLPTTGSWWPPISSSSWWASTSSWWDEPSTDRSDPLTTGSWWPPTSAPNSSWWDIPTTAWPVPTPDNPYKETYVCKNSANSVTQDVDNYGDLICKAQDRFIRTQTMFIRDTLINDENESRVNYMKYFNSSVVTKVNVLNFGRQHGFVSSVGITNQYDGYSYRATVDVNVEIPQSEEVRLFVEIYGFIKY